MTFHIDALSKADLDAYVAIMADAYPGLKIVSKEDRASLRGRLEATYEDPSTAIYGLHDGDQLLGGMILYEFSMNVRGDFVPAGGLGSLAVHLLHRKQKLAKEMVSSYLRHFRDRGAPLALLYPFRPNFYRRMGFGYGSKMNHYVFRAAGIRDAPPGGRQMTYLAEADAPEVLACHDRFAAATHGMILGSGERVRQMLSNPAWRTVGCQVDDQLSGYLTFDFEHRGHFLQNDLRVKQIIYEDAETLIALLRFLRKLADQSERIVVNTQDDTFHHLLDDPGNRSENLLPSVFHESNTQGVGLMYRVLDMGRLFSLPAPIRFGQETTTVRIHLADSFLPANSGSTLVHFEQGWPSIMEDGQPEVEIWLDVSDFSSLIMGVITFRQLVAYGQAQINDASQIGRLSRLFMSESRPVCMTTF